LKINLLLCCTCVLLTVGIVHADSLIVGTPGDAYLSTPTGPSPNLHGSLVNFDNLTPFATYSSYTSQGITISSPDGLVVLPYSTQSGPNEMFDNSSDGTADLTIDLTGGASAIGVGIADSDPVTITLQALNAEGNPFGTAFTETLSETTDNPGNGYFVVQDTTPDIYGLLITQSVGSPDFSGLAIDDVQTTPEPGTVLLRLTGIGLMLLTTRKRLAQILRPETGSQS
jgi:hypothetical protein